MSPLAAHHPSAHHALLLLGVHALLLTIPLLRVHLLLRVALLLVLWLLLILLLLLVLLLLALLVASEAELGEEPLLLRLLRRLVGGLVGLLVGRLLLGRIVGPLKAERGRITVGRESVRAKCGPVRLALH